MFTAKEVTDKVAKHTTFVLEEAPCSTEVQAKRIAQAMVLHEYETEKFWLQAFRSKYKEMLDKVRYNDSVIDKLKRDYKKKGERLLAIERFIYYLENVSYSHHLEPFAFEIPEKKVRKRAEKEEESPNKVGKIGIDIRR